MKKVLFALLSALAIANVQAADLTEGKQYIELKTERAVQPEVVEFFSFYCPHCYSFEMEYGIPEKVKNALPEGTTFKQYHVSFLGFQSENLTRAWALAMALGVEDKVKAPLFEAAQAAVKARNQNEPSADAVRKIFLDNGVTAEQFDGGLNSFAVNGLVSEQVKAAERLQVHGVPDFYVNEKFRVNPEGLARTPEGFVQDYVETVKGLLQK
ncbi:thiol:disulfide interchange protein DsbA [Caviibacterium pharyngocola]|uniref:Thiol:disulfide interchange protein n=1 Tax=Caviibacterium pharyngocola TaxID=28159 RepID=A0A2M8RT76_9PAST|nr:DsbA family protein [Caviibacterium pharyngocola]PJG82059.1 thiol:disulfide interchange protein [Caviibacterium pharyngocola]